MAAACHLAALRSHQEPAQRPPANHPPLANGFNHAASTTSGPSDSSAASSDPREHSDGDGHDTTHKALYDADEGDMQNGSNDEKANNDEKAGLRRQAEGAARKALGHALAHLKPGLSSPEAAIAHALQACVELQGSRKGRETKAEQHLRDAIILWHGRPPPAGLLMLLGRVQGSRSLTATAVHLQPWLADAWSSLRQIADGRCSSAVC